MNILIFSNMYLPHLGGVEMVVKNLASEFVERNHQVGIVSSRTSRRLRRVEEIEGVEVRRTFLGLPGTTAKSVVVFLFYFFPSFWELLRIVRKKNPDIVNLHFIDSTGFYLLLLRKWLDFPLVASIHGNDVQKFPRESWFLKAVLRRVLQRADWVTSCSASLLKDAWKYVPEIEGKSTVIVNGVDCEEFDSQADSAEEEAPYILALGRLEYKKGFDLLLRAFARISQRFPDLSLFVGGSGREEAALRKMADDLNLGERVRFLGLLDRPNVVRFLKGCELFVLPSRIEPLGIVNLEAMAAGKAVVATRVDGVPEIISDGENGLLVDSENEEQLAGAVIRLMEDEGLRSRIASYNYKVAREKYTWQKAADSYLQVYETARERFSEGK